MLVQIVSIHTDPFIRIHSYGSIHTGCGCRLDRESSQLRAAHFKVARHKWPTLRPRPAGMHAPEGRAWKGDQLRGEKACVCERDRERATRERERERDAPAGPRRTMPAPGSQGSVLSWVAWSCGEYRGTSLKKSCAPPQDHRRALGIGIL